MDIKVLKTSDIKEYAKNPRNNDEAVEYVANSIKEFGFKVPVIIDKPVISSKPSVAPATGDLFTNYVLYIGGAFILFFGWSKFRFRRFHQRKK